MTSAKRRCCSPSGISSRRSVIPRTPFIGVRISWLIVARKALFAWSAWRAAPSARASSATIAWCSRSARVRVRRKVAMTSPTVRKIRTMSKTPCAWANASGIAIVTRKGPMPPRAIVKVAARDSGPQMARQRTPPSIPATSGTT
jgi:hypothetical protein